ncbi:MAG: tetratricopeptide repeat protein, partial [Kofleriaceae bacterium]
MRFVVRASALVLLVVLAGCPRGTRRTLVPDVPQTGDAQARSRFAEARSKFLNDDGKAEDFRRIAEEFPDDPIVPWAQLYAGIAAVKERNFEVAERDLGEVIASGRNVGLTQRAELFLGITRNYRGDSRGALELLRRSERAIEGDAERTEWLAAIAFASAASDRPMSSLAAFDQLWKRVSPAERAVIVARIDEVVAAADPDLVRRAFDDL